MWDDLVLFIAVGFVAQLIDGAVGMAYGLSATSVLLSLGVSPTMASASIHVAEVFTTGTSGFAHWRMGNVRANLLWRLALPGMVGGAAGAFLLTTLPGDAIRPFINLYLLVMGGVVLWKALRSPKPSDEPVPDRVIFPLGLFGGFIDAIGGGGWGPTVTSTLVGRGSTPRYVIGSVNLAEFFVTTTISATFFATVGLELWPIIVGLILGGILAAPFAAYVISRMPDRPLMIMVGTVIVLLSLRGLIQAMTG